MSNENSTDEMYFMLIHAVDAYHIVPGSGLFAGWLLNVPATG